MIWQWLLFIYIAGVVVTGIVLAVTTYLGVRYHRELPKIPILVRTEVLLERMRQAEEDYDSLRDKLASARFTIEEGQRWKDWLVQNGPRIDELKQQEQQLVGIEAKIANLNEECERREATLRGLKENEAALCAECAHFQEMVKQLADVKHDLDNLGVKRASATESLEQANRQAKQAETELQRILKQVDVERKQLEAARSEHNRLSIEASAFKQQIEVQQRAIKLLEDQIRNLTQRASDVAPPDQKPVAERLASIWEPAIRSEELRSASPNKDEQRWLVGVKSYLQKCGLIFHDRVVNAFHTSLKIADESPLLALAGISGTGKSLLPRRYAEGMGMHFLNIPVQPNWDSPLDLLGFFNHLEGRYKPTELMRAMLQMDLHSKNELLQFKPSERYHNCSSRMLLILLDEMNIARVEYYFSDFLSKLEMRRDTKRDKVIDPRKWQIGVEIGGGSKDVHQTLPIIVDTNTLVVGTMNEDESTQTLSDKVVDRANVLRFGRPRELQGALRDGTTGEPAKDHLPYKTWCDWINTQSELEHVALEAVGQWITRCNDARALIRRPFAHRTDRAIRAYLQHYPDRSEQGLKDAMADQIEQRIMPKLRGIDPGEGESGNAISQVGNLVRDLGDEMLTKAIEDGSRGHIFVWQGVDRHEQEPMNVR